MPLADISSEDEKYVFMEFAAKAVADVRRKADRLYLCLDGGRKEMVASMMLMAQLANVDAAYHVVSLDVKAFNAALERIRKNIEDLAGSPSPNDYYKQHRDIFEPVMYPPPSSYRIVAVPIIPYPPETIRALKALFSSQQGPRKTTVFSEEFLKRLADTGFVSLTKDKINFTDLGSRFYEPVLNHLI